MKINIKENYKEKVILLSIIGSLVAIKGNAVSIDEIEKFLFSPYMKRILKAKGCNDKVLSIIDEGCELEDIQSLLPNELNDVIDELMQEAMLLLRSYDEYKYDHWLEN